MPLQHAAAGLREGNAGFANLVFAQLDMSGGLVPGLGLCVCRRSLLRRGREPDRPADPSRRRNDQCNAGGHAGEK